MIMHDRNITSHSAPVAEDDFLTAMAGAATGVSIVTTNGTMGQFGVTVSAVSSVSAEPPLLLACVNRKSPAASAITSHGLFAVNILADSQVDIATIFAGRPLTGTPYDFTAHDWVESQTRLPILPECTACFECAVDSYHDAGTHRIFIGRVLKVAANDAKPLVYTARLYHKAQPID